MNYLRTAILLAGLTALFMASVISLVARAAR